jgi:hypothetical protein
MPDPAPTPAPLNTFSEVLNDDQIAQLQEQEHIAKMQWEHFSRGGPLFLPGKPGYKESRVIPPSWQEATDHARLERLRQELNLPINSPRQQEEPSGLQPRHSGRERRPVVCPDNVYESQNPTQSEQMSDREFREIVDDVPALSGSGNRPDSPANEGKGKKCANYLVKMVQEESAGLTNFLLSAAV